MMGRGSLYSCARHDRHGAEPCKDCLAIGQRTDDWRASNTKYTILRRQYDELAADNGRLLAENAQLRTALAWYADEDTWACLDDNHVAHTAPGDCLPAIDGDCGERARKALRE